MTTLSRRARLVLRMVPRLAPRASTPVDQQRAQTERSALGPGRAMVADDVRLGGVPCVQVRPKGRFPQEQILHFHGGGFVIGTARTFLSMVGYLARAADRTVVSVDYRLAPEHRYPAAVDDGVAAYRALLEYTPADQIVLVGESAGGNAVIAVLVRARDEGLPMPAAAVVLSPWVDLTFSGPSFVANRPTEVLLAEDTLTLWRDHYVGEADPTDPGISPLFADLSGLPPLHIQATTAEILEDDARRLADAARNAGVSVDLHLYDELFHVFQTQTLAVPEAREAIDRAVAFIRAHG